MRGLKIEAVYCMKQLIFFAAFISSIALSGFRTKSIVENSSSIHNNVDTTVVSGTWQLLPVLASDTSAGKIPQLNFNLKTNKFSGNSGCNAISGEFMINNDALTFSKNIISTRMACPGYNEKAFLESLLKTNRYEIKNGVLQLMYNTTVLSQWVRHEDKNPTKEI